jgi:stage II sporulation protein GA (sporulation sigma-E factor processing peptidase)
MNAVIFLGTARIVGVSLRWGRIIGGSLLGAMITIATLLPYGAFLRWPLVKVLISLLLVGMVFYPVPRRRWSLILLVFYLVSFVLGGIVLASLYFMDASSYLTNGVFLLQPLWVTVIAGAVVLLIWGHWVWGRLATRLWQKKYVVSVRIFMSGKHIQVSSLMDSGNSLRDPISRIPVVVIEYTCVKPLLPVELSALLDDAEEEDWLSVLQHLPYEIVSRLHIIPFSSIGRKQGLLLGFRPDFLEIEENGEKKRVSTVIVGMCHGHLSKQGEYHALLHPELIQHDINHEKEAS